MRWMGTALSVALCAAPMMGAAQSGEVMPNKDVYTRTQINIQRF